MQNKQLENIRRLSGSSLFLFIILSVAMIYVIRNLRYYTNMTDHTQQVLVLTSNIQSSVLRTETNLRAFAITQQENFYESFVREKENISSRLTDLKQYISDNPVQVKNAEELHSSIRDRMASLDSTATDVREPSVAAQERIVTRVRYSFIQTERVRAALNTITGVEQGLLASRKNDLFFNLKLLLPILIVIFITAIIITVMNLFTIKKFIVTRKRYEAEIEKYQQELREQIQNLEATNKELEQFAYVASHDLQEPLRKIISFSELLEEHISGSLDADGKAYLGRITNSAGRMRVLIQDLLSYSRAGRFKEEPQPVDLNTVVTEVLDDLSVLIQDKKAEITTEKLPVAVGNPTLYKQVFQNLVANALKFSQPGKAPVIHIVTRQAGEEQLRQHPELSNPSGYNEITVEDNGIGFSQEYSEKVFLIFQRLHARDAYEGTGIGLAVCKKIIQHFGGKIFVTSEMNKGSRFIILLPVVA